MPRVWHANRGIAIQCNWGAEKASGDVLLFLSADSVLPEGWLSLPFRMRCKIVESSPVGFASRLKIPIPFSGAAVVLGKMYVQKRIALIVLQQGFLVRKEFFWSVTGLRQSILRYPFIHLCGQLRKAGEIVMLSLAVISSSRQWHQEGGISATLRLVVLTSTERHFCQ